MPISFNGLAIPGHCQAPYVAAPELDVVRTKFPGVNAVSEIFSGRGGRLIIYPVWIFGDQFKNVADVIKFLDSLDDVVGSNGSLVESGTISRKFTSVTFEGFDNQGAPILPVLGSGMQGTHWTRGLCRFYQLKV